MICRTLRECVDWNIVINVWWINVYVVALFVSAWIETVMMIIYGNLVRVALFVSAWIETSAVNPLTAGWSVALFVSAWIETNLLYGGGMSVSRTLRECVDWNFWTWRIPSKAQVVALFVSAWIETWWICKKERYQHVALFVSAWIETEIAYLLSKGYLSHSSWVRGLKPPLSNTNFHTSSSHSSWVRGLKHLSTGFNRLDNNVALFVSAWIETMLLAVKPVIFDSRTLRECVDWN